MSSRRKGTVPVNHARASAEDLAAARAETVKVVAILADARRHGSAVELTEASRRANTKVMNEMRLGSQRAFQRRVRAKELIPKEELMKMLGPKRRWVRDALKAGRLFSLIDADGLEYFPVFFGNGVYDRKALGDVVKALAGLPEESKYFFFLHVSSRLQMTPLQALEKGRKREVVVRAAAFATS